MVASPNALQIRWEKLPDDFVLPDDPVDNIAQPALAAALTDALTTAGQLAADALITTNYGLCATVNGKVVVKAQDWAFVPHITVARADVHRSYTPQLQGDLPLIVMEFWSDEAGNEYSSKPTYPPGKWFFYEQVLQVPYYALFGLESNTLEFYQLGADKRYDIVKPDAADRYWIPEMALALGRWSGQREDRDGVWLRWWDAAGSLLPWAQEQATAEWQRANRLAARLQELGIDPEGL
ncbi:MAG: Uma2 family endonuclease [Cyanobacteria bacterium P01_D01_bin.115]